jgi:hypothetical protein
VSISPIALSVVYSLPAIIQVVRRPRSRSFRRPLAVIPPNGNACSATTASRNGAFGSTLSFAGIGNFISLSHHAKGRLAGGQLFSNAQGG